MKKKIDKNWQIFAAKTFDQQRKRKILTVCGILDGH